MREPPQPVGDHVQELASSGRGNRDGSLRSRNSDRNWPSQGRGTGMYLFGFGVVQGVLGNKGIKDRDEFIGWMKEKSDKSLIACRNAQVVFEAIIHSREK